MALGLGENVLEELSGRWAMKIWGNILLLFLIKISATKKKMSQNYFFQIKRDADI